MDVYGKDRREELCLSGSKSRILEDLTKIVLFSLSIQYSKVQKISWNIIDKTIDAVLCNDLTIIILSILFIVYTASVPPTKK